MNDILLLSTSDRAWKEKAQSPSLFIEGGTIKIADYAEFQILETRDGISGYDQIAFVSPPISM